MIIFGKPDMNKECSNIVNNLVQNAKFWIDNGYDAEAAFARVKKNSSAGPLPIKMAREALGLPV